MLFLSHLNVKARTWMDMEVGSAQMGLEHPRTFGNRHVVNPQKEVEEERQAKLAGQHLNRLQPASWTHTNLWVR